MFVGVSDPVGAALVDTLARPGGNVTGFMIFEYSLSGKWLELLKEIAPRLMIVTPSASVSAHHDLIVMLAARYKLPAVYSTRPMVIGGGLICYGPDIADQFRQAAGYADRILKGDKLADLPVQAPTKYETTINLTTAKSLGLTIPSVLLVAADEVME